MDDDFGADADFIAALAASGPSTTTTSRPAAAVSGPPRVQQPTPQRIQRPGAGPPPQRLDRAPPSNASAPGPKVVQPTPQALPGRSSGSAILVSPRQKGNPVLACLKSLPWEYSDIVADYGLGATTCALFLSLKYHRLHPEYVYTRIRNLQGKYNLRILLTLVDITSHEDSLRELSKTSLVNNVTVILCWSAAEAARYLELYKSYEHASFAAIRGQQATSYAEKLVEFVTVPRSVNKADAVALVSSFGSLRNAINADPEQIGFISGWGETKVKNWCKAIESPFRVKRAAKRKMQRDVGGDEDGEGRPSQRRTHVLDQAVPLGRVPLREMTARTTATTGSLPDDPTPPPQPRRIPTGTGPARDWSPDLADEEEAMLAAAIEQSKKQALPSREAAGSSSSRPSRPAEPELSEGVAAALARLREKG